MVYLGSAMITHLHVSLLLRDNTDELLDKSFVLLMSEVCCDQRRPQLSSVSNSLQDLLMGTCKLTFALLRADTQFEM